MIGYKFGWMQFYDWSSFCFLAAERKENRIHLSGRGFTSGYLKAYLALEVEQYLVDIPWYPEPSHKVDESQ